MTEDILFDNIYVGTSPEDAAKLAAETFMIKQKIEKEIADAEKPKEEPAAPTEVPAFAEQPVAFLRQKALAFVEAAKEDPVAAFKAQPETGAVLLAVLLTFLGSLGALFGVVGSSGVQRPTPAPKVASKNEKKAVAADAAGAAKTPVAPAGEEKEKQQGDLKKRATAPK
ncbi:hypothetical protein FRC08_002327 [Ceratobasidium sp. 394]|nr:hypothetical protein FRC08_002327 [Ceratobasidium sp. 394]